MAVVFSEAGKVSRLNCGLCLERGTYARRPRELQRVLEVNQRSGSIEAGMKLANRLQAKATLAFRNGKKPGFGFLGRALHD